MSNYFFSQNGLGNVVSLAEQSEYIQFLKNELGDYSDPIKDIKACLDYILDPQKGGHIFFVHNKDKQLVGLSFVVKTHMELFVPDYLLVYIAVAKAYRSEGLGTKLMRFIQETLNAPIALHVEYDNPAKELYHRLGFTTKYAEMRWFPSR